MRGDRWKGALLLGVAAACAQPTAPAAGHTDQRLTVAAAAGGVSQSVAGGGQFVHPDFGTVTFAFTAQRLSDGRVVGRFQQHQPAFGVTYKGDVTCFAVDAVNHRAWIGGVLTQSNDPDPVALAGKDAWFRVLDPEGGGSIGAPSWASRAAAASSPRRSTASRQIWPEATPAPGRWSTGPSRCTDPTSAHPGESRGYVTAHPYRIAGMSVARQWLRGSLGGAGLALAACGGSTSRTSATPAAAPARLAVDTVGLPRIRFTSRLHVRHSRRQSHCRRYAGLRAGGGGGAGHAGPRHRLAGRGAAASPAGAGRARLRGRRAALSSRHRGPSPRCGRPGFRRAGRTSCV